jgi:hypothetical protein
MLYVIALIKTIFSLVDEPALIEDSRAEFADLNYWTASGSVTTL